MLAIPSTGNGFIDDHHETLINLLNDYERNWKNDGISASLENAAHGFVASLISHFRHEEVILKGAGYAALEEHIYQHRVISNLLETIIDKGLSGSTKGCP